MMAVRSIPEPQRFGLLTGWWWVHPYSLNNWAIKWQLINFEREHLY